MKLFFFLLFSIIVGSYVLSNDPVEGNSNIKGTVVNSDGNAVSDVPVIIQGYL